MSDDLEARRAATRDEARPDAVGRRHAAGGRTARENVADLVDPGSFVEYGRLAVAAQRGRRDLQELIERTPADGLVAGTARINGGACAVLSYDYTVLAGTQGMLGHRKKDRLFELIERMRLPTVAIEDEAEREQRVRELTAAAQENAAAINAATLFELDDVVEPAETRGLIAATLAAAPPVEPGGRGFVDTW